MKSRQRIWLHLPTWHGVSSSELWKGLARPFVRQSRRSTTKAQIRTGGMPPGVNLPPWEAGKSLEGMSDPGFNSTFDHLWIAGTTLSIFAEFANGAARSLWKRDEMSI